MKKTLAIVGITWLALSAAMAVALCIVSGMASEEERKQKIESGYYYD